MCFRDFDWILVILFWSLLTTFGLSYNIIITDSRVQSNYQILLIYVQISDTHCTRREWGLRDREIYGIKSLLLQMCDGEKRSRDFRTLFKTKTISFVYDRWLSNSFSSQMIHRISKPFPIFQVKKWSEIEWTFDRCLYEKMSLAFVEPIVSANHSF